MKEWQYLFWDACKRKYKRAEGKMRVKVVSHRKKLMDLDNLFGGLKVVLDAMRGIGLIQDDSPEHIDLDVSQVKIPGKTKAFTEIHLEECNG